MRERGGEREREREGGERAREKQTERERLREREREGEIEIERSRERTRKRERAFARQKNEAANYKSSFYFNMTVLTLSLLCANLRSRPLSVYCSEVRLPSGQRRRRLSIRGVGLVITTGICTVQPCIGWGIGMVG